MGPTMRPPWASEKAGLIQKCRTVNSLWGEIQPEESRGQEESGHINSLIFLCPINNSETWVFFLAHPACVKWVHLPQDLLCLSVAYLKGSIVTLHLVLLNVLPNPPFLLFNPRCCSGSPHSHPSQIIKAMLRKRAWVNSGNEYRSGQSLSFTSLFSDKKDIDSLKKLFRIK